MIEYLKIVRVMIDKTKRKETLSLAFLPQTSTTNLTEIL